MKIGVVIGRFQPFHAGHAALIDQAARETDQVIVVLGSSNRCRSIKNPFTVAERKSVIINWASTMSWYVKKPLLEFVSAPDNLYKEWSWKSEIVRGVTEKLPTGADCEIYLYAHEKDDSSYYVNEFPEWNLVKVDNHHDISATQFRKSFFEDGIVCDYYLCSDTRFLMHKFKDTDDYQSLLEDWEFFKWEKRAFAEYPFPETLNFMCSDSVVVCQGHVLMIERLAAPGRGTYALPGGFKNANESFLDCCIRELKEETNLRIPEKVLRGSVKAVKMFDDPRRSLGIPRVSMGYHIEVMPNPDGSLPQVRPDSDAAGAEWIPLSTVLSMNLFEDHADIIRWFI